MKSWLRFGQPIGSALITAALLDTIINFFWLLLNCCSLEYNTFFPTTTADFEYCINILWNFVIFLRPLLSILLWAGVIFWGKKLILISWLVISLIDDIVLFSTVIYQYTGLEVYANPWGIPLPNPIPMILSLVLFISFRIYSLLVIIQGIIRLHRKYDHSRATSESENFSDIDICLEPIGLGVFQTWEFYKDLPGMAVIILLTVELIWNVLHLGSRELFASITGMFGKDAFIELEVDTINYVILEDNIMRCIRIFLAFAGLVFVKKEQLNLVRLWIVVYFLSIVCSDVIFAFAVVKGLNWIVFYAISVIGDNLFKLIVLYFSCKFAVVHTRNIIKTSDY